MSTTTYRVRTGSGTVHSMTAGRTYKQRGDVCTNRADAVIGKADCGAATSSAAALTEDAVTCVKCAAVAPAPAGPSHNPAACSRKGCTEAAR